MVEILVVMAIIAILASLAVVALPGIMSSQSLAQAASDISQTLDDARSYAMANHTYVFVGFEEVDASKASTAPGQSQASAGVGGRIAVAIVASQDGTNNSTSLSPYFNTSNLVSISKLKFFGGVHLSDFTDPSVTAAAAPSPMAARVTPISSANSLGAHSTGGTTALFTWPLNGVGVQYSFFPSQIIMFDQEGVAVVVTSSTYTSTTFTNGLTLTPAWVEIGLQVAHGNATLAPPSNLATGQIVALQLDGVTGSNRVLRP